MASIKTTSVTEPWSALQPYLLGGHLLAPPVEHDWKSAFAETMMPLLMLPSTEQQKKKPVGQALLGGGF